MKEITQCGNITITGVKAGYCRLRYIATEGEFSSEIKPSVMAAIIDLDGVKYDKMYHDHQQSYANMQNSGWVK